MSNIDEEQRILRMQVTLQKAENMLSVFYTDLNIIRNQVGDNNLSDWCLFKLERSFDRINMLANCLKRDDAVRVKQELKVAREQALKGQEEEKEKVRLAKFEKERSELDRQLELARRKAELIKLKQRKAVRKRVKEHGNERDQRAHHRSTNGSTSIST